MATPEAVSEALSRSLQSSRERGWNFRMGDDFQGAQPPQAQQPDNSWRAGWPDSVPDETVRNAINNPERANAFFAAPQENRDNYMAHIKKWNDAGVHDWDIINRSAFDPAYNAQLQQFFAKLGG